MSLFFRHADGTVLSFVGGFKKGDPIKEAFLLMFQEFSFFNYDYENTDMRIIRRDITQIVSNVHYFD